MTDVMDQIYLETAAERFPSIEHEVLLQSRDVNCEAFELTPSPDTWVQLVKTLTEAGVGAEDAGYLIGIQVRTACPEYVEYLP